MTIPNGVQNGDLLLAFYSYWYPTSATAPTGWQLLQTSPSSNSGVETVWYRFANNDQPGSTYNWSFSSSAYEAGGMLAYRSVDPSAPQDGSCVTQGRGTNPSLCSFTTSNNNDRYVGFYATENTGLALPGDLTSQVLTQYSPGSFFGVAAADKTVSSAGSIPADIGSMNSGGWETIAIALKPLNPGPSPTATATSSTPTATPTVARTATATVVPTITPPPPTATSTATLIPPTKTATATATATAAPSSITFVGSTSTTSTSLLVPSGVQNGDLMLAFYSYWASASANAPSGWQLLQTSASSSSGITGVWYRFANGDAPGATYTWSFNGTPYESGGMLAYRGVDPNAPQDGACVTQGRSTTPSLCSLTTANSNDRLVGFYTTENSGLTLPGDLAGQLLMQYTPGFYFGSATADKTLGAAGSIPADVGSMNSGGWETVAIALKPLSTSPPSPTATATATQVAPTATATATPGAAAITFVGSSTTTTSSMTVPSGVQNGDLMLAFYSYWFPSSATAPSGWQLLQTSASSSSGIETVWYRIANGDTPGATYTWSFSGTPYESGGMLAYRGVDPSAPQDGACITQGRNSAPSLCSISTSFTNDRYVGFYATENTGLALPGDLTAQVLTQYAAGSYFGSAAADKTLSSAGSTPADVGSMNSAGWETVAVALKAQGAH